MTTQEFSNTFDTLLNSYAAQAQFGEGASNATITLDEYEKSVLLTQAQDIILKQYFERSNTNLGFDESTRRQVDFSNLITVAKVTPVTGVAEKKFAESSYLFELPTTKVTLPGESTATNISKVLFILNEKLVLTKSNNPDRIYVVVPINYHEYDRQMSKPFAQPLKKQAWRLLQDNAAATIDGTLYAEIVTTDAAYQLTTNTGGYSANYKIRYIRRPRPIVLTDLSGSGLSIDGVQTLTECELNPILHMDILNKAVELALTTRGTARPSTERPKE